MCGWFRQLGLVEGSESTLRHVEKGIRHTGETGGFLEVRQCVSSGSGKWVL
jgi:hypothetical protein